MSGSGPRLRGGLMVCGTTSDAGKTTVVAALCRSLARRGVSVAPFKAQNMALNAMVTREGGEIGRAQWIQAVAAGVEPEVAMNPVLLKPTGERTSQVVVSGRALGVMTAAEYHAHKPALLATVLDALADLRARFDVVLCEGAGSPAEINLLEHDIVNLRIAHDAGLAAIVVGDIDLGGVFAALYGTVALLPEHYRALVQGFVINKLRGDPALLFDGCSVLEQRSGVPTLGVLPWLEGADLDAEDSVALRRPWPSTPAAGGDELDVAIVALPRISNATDVEPLAVEPGVRVRLVHDGAGLGRPDLVVLPGSKATVEDLGWLRDRGLDAAIAATDATVLGICGGYQMLGATIEDDVESRGGRVDGLGLLPVRTRFETAKVTRLRTGVALGRAVRGYQIHHGRVRPTGGEPFVVLDPDGDGDGDGDRDGAVDGVRCGGVCGTTLHGAFEADDFRRAFLVAVAERSGKRWVPGTATFAAHREARLDRLADAVDAHLDVAAIDALVARAAPGARR
jgi:adenosylcobyric acid synthase